MPTSQQQAQDTVLILLQSTVDALPDGSSLDGSRYLSGQMDRFCDQGEQSTVHIEDWRDIELPSGTDPDAEIAHIGSVWSSWGWRVIERDNFGKPNRYGYAPDGFTLHVEARSHQGDDRPLLIGLSPCYPSSLHSDVPRNPPAVTQSPPN